jgi:mono/diheme cytochrome c family protein
MKSWMSSRRRRQRHSVAAGSRVTAVLCVALLHTIALADPPVTGLAAAAYTDAQAARGETLYVDHCAACHRDDLTGLGPSPALAGNGFMARWSQRAAQELFDKLRTTMPQGAPGSLTPAQYADLVAFLLSANGLSASELEFAPPTPVP